MEQLCILKKYCVTVLLISINYMIRYLLLLFLFVVVVVF